MFFYSFSFCCRWHFISIVVTAIMAPWITEWSIATMESKVVVESSSNYYVFCFLFLCIYGGTRGRCSRSVLTCGLSVVAKTRMSLWKLVADMSYRFFSGALAHPNLNSCPFGWEGTT